MLIDVYRLYSEGSGELLESFEICCHFLRSSYGLSGTLGEATCRHTVLLCVGIYEELWIA